MTGEQGQGTLSVTDNRTGADLRDPDRGRGHPGPGPARHQGRRGRLRAALLRPAFGEHRQLPQRHHLHRRRAGDPALPRLSHPGAGRAGQLPRELAWLLVSGDLPEQPQLADWTDQINHHTFVKENIKKFIDGFPANAHPMGILVGTVGALSVATRTPRRSSGRRSAAARPCG